MYKTPSPPKNTIYHPVTLTLDTPTLQQDKPITLYASQSSAIPCAHWVPPFTRSHAMLAIRVKFSTNLGAKTTPMDKIALLGDQGDQTAQVKDA
ncbi:hypothetical protein Tco_1136153 [Tanacetum coccineum]